jgi:hypothetical protein
MIPQTQYARSGDVNIAHQVFGAGPIDLVVVPGWISCIETFWEEPDSRALLRHPRLVRPRVAVRQARRGLWTGTDTPTLRGAARTTCVR